MPRHSGLYPLLEGHGRKAATNFKIESTKKNVLLLGSGFVAKLLVDYLLRDSNIRITIGEFIFKQAQILL
jgi:hypothetical protein